MIFVETTVVMYAVGRAHPLQAEAREFFEMQVSSGQALVSSADVLQELLHAYLPGARDLLHLACCMRHGADEIRTFDRALDAAFRS